MTKPTYVPVNSEGRRINMGHPKARFSDADIEVIQQMHETGLGYRRIARAFKTSPSSIQSILTCRTRSQWADRVKPV